MALTGNQRRHLRALGHHLDAVVQVGHQGVTEAVGRALSRALNTHELVKVRLAAAVDDRDAAAKALAVDTGAEVVQQIGRTVLLYLRRKKDPTIVLPKARSGAAAKDVDEPDAKPAKATKAKKSKGAPVPAKTDDEAGDTGSEDE